MSGMHSAAVTLARVRVLTASTGLIWTRISVLRDCCLARSRQKVPPRSSGGNKSGNKPPDAAEG